MVSVGNNNGENDGTNSTSFKNEPCNSPMIIMQPKKKAI